MDFIDEGTGLLGEFVGGFLVATPMLQSLVVDGIITGVGSVVIFLPQIIILFLFIAFLEDSGYLARAAFLMDRLLGWTGLNGRAFIPMLSSFACAVPGVMAARVHARSPGSFDDDSDRAFNVLLGPAARVSADDRRVHRTAFRRGLGGAHAFRHARPRIGRRLTGRLDLKPRIFENPVDSLRPGIAGVSLAGAVERRLSRVRSLEKIPGAGRHGDLRRVDHDLGDELFPAARRDRREYRSAVCGATRRRARVHLGRHGTHD